MKHYSIGLVIGASLGVALSLYKDKKGKRLCPELQDQLQDIRNDAKDISIATNNLKKANRELQTRLPCAKQSISDMQNAIKYYQTSANYGRKRLKTKISEFKTKNITMNEKVGQ